MSQKNKGKMNILIALICSILLLIILLTITLNHSSATVNDNILYYSEELQTEREDKVLVVGLYNEEQENSTNESETPKIESPYYIKINNQANVVTVYKKDSKGNYVIPVKAMICSVGEETPETGVYTLSDKYEWRFLQGDVYGQYACRITGHILFHSVPYEKEDKSTLEWWEYDKLGGKASLGCVRLTVEDAKWIYDNCISGTKVEFYSSSNPGPLGKPTVQKISEDEKNRNWDPTDPDEENPWNNK